MSESPIKSSGQSARRGIFIGGCPRSGTTMLGSALGVAADAVVTHESHFKRKILELARHANQPLTPESLYSIARDDDQFIAFWEMVPTVRVAGSEDPFETARSVVFDIVDQFAAKVGRPDWQSWIDHSPPNLQQIQILLKLDPDARFIHLVRDGRAVAASILPLDWGPADALTAGSWWVYELAHGLAAELSFPDRVIRVRYEDLVTNPEAELRRICNHIGLKFHPGMLSADALTKPIYVQGTHQLVGSAIAPSQVSSWRAKLSRREIELFEYGAGHMLEALGYQPATEAHTRYPTDFERAVSLLRTPALKLMKRWRHRAREARASRAVGSATRSS